MRGSQILEPVRRSWVLVWLIVVLALSLWAVWSAEHADDDADTAAAQHCVQQQTLIARTNRDATDVLIDQWNAVERLTPIADETSGRVHGAIVASLRSAQQNLDRRLDDLPPADYRRVLDQLQMGQQVIPPVEFVPAVSCSARNPKS